MQQYCQQDPCLHHCFGTAHHPFADAYVIFPPAINLLRACTEVVVTLDVNAIAIVRTVADKDPILRQRLRVSESREREREIRDVVLLVLWEW